jgi:hypothetical protein
VRDALRHLDAGGRCVARADHGDERHRQRLAARPDILAADEAEPVEPLL